MKHYFPRLESRNHHSTLGQSVQSSSGSGGNSGNNYPSSAVESDTYSRLAKEIIDTRLDAKSTKLHIEQLAAMLQSLDQGVL